MRAGTKNLGFHRLLGIEGPEAGRVLGMDPRPYNYLPPLAEGEKTSDEAIVKAPYILAMCDLERASP